MFGWFRSQQKHVHEVPGMVWRDEVLKYRGLLHKIKNDRQNYAAVLTFAHFEPNLVQLEGRLRDAQVTFNAFQSHFALRSDGQAPLLLGLRQRLPYRQIAAERPDMSQRIMIHVIDRHPLPKSEELMADFAASLPYAVTLMRHISLEDPLIQTFTSEKIVDFLHSHFGRADYIQHKMIDRAIASTQRKVAKRVERERPAETCEAWFERNLPDGFD